MLENDRREARRGDENRASWEEAFTWVAVIHRYERMFAFQPDRPTADRRRLYGTGVFEASEDSTCRDQSGGPLPVPRAGDQHASRKNGGMGPLFSR